MAGTSAPPKKSATLNAFFAPRASKKAAAPAALKRASEESTSSTEAVVPAPKKSKVDADAPMAPPPATKTEETPPKATDDGAPAWAASGAVPYDAVARTFAKIEDTTKRLEITGLVRDLLLDVIAHAPADLEATLFLLCNKVAPAFENLEMGIGDSLLQKAVANAFGRTVRVVKDEYERVGDLGIVAEDARKKQKFLSFGAKPKPLAAARVLATYREICAISGSKSQDAKIGKMQKLMIAATPLEARFVTRGLQGKLRIGLAESTVLAGLARALARTPPAGARAYEAEFLGDDAGAPHSSSHLDLGRETTGAAAAAILENDARLRRRKEKRVLGGDARDVAADAVVKQCYAEAPSYKTLADGALARPLWALPSACALAVGTPVFPMLAKPTKSVGEVLKRLAGLAITCEHKYDGERFQAHMVDGVVTVFSRNLQDTTKKWPEVREVVKAAAAAKGTTSFVLDAEVVAVDPATGALLPFQRLSTRKKEATTDDVSVAVIVMAFDCLLLDGRSLLREPLRTRRDRMRAAFAPVEHKFAFADATDVDAAGDAVVAAELIQQALEESIVAKSEGLMIKTLESNATYEPSKRSLNWLKLKKDYLDGVGDSLDLVVVGAYAGRGKRTGVYGAYLLACLDADSGDLQSVCKLGTGFSDDDLKTFDAAARKKRLPAKPAHVKCGDALEHDIHWLEPDAVWEIQVADLSLSDTHKGALGRVAAGRGIGLRFPRLLRARDDKDADHATTADQVLDMYRNQDSVKDVADDDDDDDDDGFL